MGKSYWMLVILARKVSIAFCSLVFRTNPGFMLASVVLILFVSFSLQTRHSPFMSSSQRQLVLAKHSIKAEAGDHMHLRIRNNILHVQEQVKRKKNAKTQKKAKMRFTSTGVDMGKKKEEDKVVQFFLFCAVLVCLAGVMFESDRFKETDGGGDLRYSWQRDMVTFFVVFIVMISLLYILVVVLNELTGWTPPCIHQCHKNKDDAMLSAAKTIQQQKDDHIEMSIVNPTMISDMGPQERALFEQQMADQQKKTQLMEKEKNALLLERRKLKGMVAAQKRGKAKSGGNRGNRGKKAKKDFASVALEDDGHSVEQADIDVVAAAQKSSHSRNQSFQRHVSSEGHVYYSNSVTKETVWELPEGAIVL